LVGSDDILTGLSHEGKCFKLKNFGASSKPDITLTESDIFPRLFLHSLKIPNINHFKAKLLAFLESQGLAHGNGLEKPKHAASLDNLYLELHVHNSWKSISSHKCELLMQDNEIINLNQKVSLT